jgi:Sugar-transfer associated ATP-grasp
METLLDRPFGQLEESVPRLELRTLSATDEDVRHFRQIRFQQKRTQLNQWLAQGPGTRLRKILARINRDLGNPGRIWRAFQAAVRGTYRSGTAVAARHKIGIATQFLQIFAEVTRSGILFEEYYLYQLYLPERWRARKRQFPKDSQSGPAQQLLMERSPQECQLLIQKHLFAARCKEAGLRNVRLLAQFIDEHPDEKFEALPAKDLFSKPANGKWGGGAESWRYDRGQNCFFNASTDQKFSGDALFDHLCDISRSGRVILQNKLRNHAALSPLTNGALSTLRIVTCTTPLGSIDFLPPVIRMPAGRLVVDNFALGGLAAPVDFVTGKISGPAVKKDNRLGIISIDKHPDSGQELKGFPIPMWSEAVDLARRAHETFPSMYFIAWDIAILEDGPILVEGNIPADTAGPVLTHGLTLSDTQFISYYNHHWANSALADAAKL